MIPLKSVARSGRSIVEYAVLIGLVALVSIPALGFLAESLRMLYADNDPVSRADQLFSLLDPKSKPYAGSGSYGMLTNGQPVNNLLLDYDASTGLVRLAAPTSSATGTHVTSGEGTNILARNLAQIRIDYGDSLSAGQKEALTRLSETGFAIAQVEQKLLAEFPQFESDRQNVPDLSFFPMPGEDRYSWTEDLTTHYQTFTAQYQELVQNMRNCTNPRTAEARSIMEDNAAVISQLAYYNFMVPQLEYEPEPQIVSMIQDTMVSGAVDVTQVSVSESPGETRSSSVEIQAQEKTVQGGP